MSTLTEYLREQPDGWLSAHHLMKSLRHTLRAIPAPDAQGRTRIEPPRADQRALLKRNVILKLLRRKAARSEADKTRLMPVMGQLLAGLITIDPARAAVLCG